MKSSFQYKLSKLCQTETSTPKYVQPKRNPLKDPLLSMKCETNVILDFYVDIMDWNSRNELAFSLTQMIYSISTSGEFALIYQAPTLNQYEAQLVITSVAFYNDNYVVFGDAFGVLRIVEIQTQKIVFEQEIHNDRINKILVIDNLIVTASKDGFVKVINPNQQEHIINNCLVKHDAEVCGMTVNSNNSYFASGCNDGVVKVTDLRSQIQIHSHKHSAAVKAMTFSPSRNNILLTGGGMCDRMIKMYNVDTHEYVKHHQTLSQISSLYWKDDYVIVSHGNPTNTLEIFDADQFVTISHSNIHTENILYTKMNKNGNLATFDENGMLNLWKLE